MPDERSNSLIIVATERAYLRILELIKYARRADRGRRRDPRPPPAARRRGRTREDAQSRSPAAAHGGGGARGAPASAAAGGGAAATAGVFEGTVRDHRRQGAPTRSSSRRRPRLRLAPARDRPARSARRQVFIEAVDHGTRRERHDQARRQLARRRPGTRRERTRSCSAASARRTRVGSGLAAHEPRRAPGFAVGVHGPIISGSQNLVPGLSLGIPAFGVVINALAHIRRRRRPLDAAHHRDRQQRRPRSTSARTCRCRPNVASAVSAHSPALGAPGAAGAPAAALGALGRLGWPGFGGVRARTSARRSQIMPHINDSNEIRLEIERRDLASRRTAVGALGVVPINSARAKTTARRAATSRPS